MKVLLDFEFTKKTFITPNTFTFLSSIYSDYQVIGSMMMFIFKNLSNPVWAQFKLNSYSHLLLC